MAQTILLYSVPAELHREITKICNRLGIETKKIARKRFLQPIGCHACLPGFEQTAEWYEGQDLPSPMIIFSGLSDAMLDKYLYEYRQSGLPEIKYRAIVTKHNIHWTVLDLYQELVQERESFETAGK